MTSKCVLSKSEVVHCLRFEVVNNDTDKQGPSTLENEAKHIPCTVTISNSSPFSVLGSKVSVLEPGPPQV